ncbi:MAG: hypothetical protein HY304_00925 [candidate division Zixibacteria bacterium]|nr:hypothetical protein [candidate division Zixibacteria bacterium]
MLAIFMIVAAAGVLFVVLTLLMKKTDSQDGIAPVEEKRYGCAICQEEFVESDLISRTVGEAGYRRYFCDRCVIELYEESRLLHDPRSKE